MRHFKHQPIAYVIALVLGCLSTSTPASKNSDDIVVKPAIDSGDSFADNNQPVQEETADITLTTGGVHQTYSAASAPASSGSDSTRIAPHAHDADMSDTATVGFYGELIVSGKATGGGLPGGYGYSTVIGSGHVQDAETIRPVSVFHSDR